MKIDMHIHTMFSRDGSMSISRITDILKKKGLDGFAVTDHNNIKAFSFIKKYKGDMKIIRGCEIKTKKGEILAYFINEEIVSKDVREVIREIRKQDGIVSIPHPFDIFRKSAMKTHVWKIIRLVDAIEVFNSRCLLNRFNLLALKVAKRYNLGLTAGSDAHFAYEVGSAGIIAEGDIKDAILNRTNQIFFKRINPEAHILTAVKKII